MFRLAAELRRRMLDAGFSDNGGAIHSAERILNILGQRLCYPGLSHINNLRNHPKAPFSVKALGAHKARQRVLAETLGLPRQLHGLGDLLNRKRPNDFDIPGKYALQHASCGRLLSLRRPRTSIWLDRIMPSRSTKRQA